MLATPINENQIVEALHALPVARWPEVLAYIDSLRVKDTEGDLAPVLTTADLAGSPLVGAWADGTELENSQEFARRLREGVAAEKLAEPFHPLLRSMISG